ncbi:hypothetical protein SAMN02910453_0454 [Lachnospiraceae bacterium A10]|nr:hypothetical protein SAMN02910453_0454 [Lachnospiraceae bacterium A10]
MGALYFKEIKFGKTDASNELSEVGNGFYMSSFLEYERYRINDFVDGKMSFIIGRKGTGKTALLKFLECKFSDNPENLVVPIRFKSDFDEIDRKNVKTASVTVQEEIINNDNKESLKSYVVAWQVYLIYQIFKRVQSGDNEYSVFSQDKQYELIWKLLKIVYGENGSGKIVPKISKGFINVSAGKKGIDADLGLEIEFHDNQVNFELTAKKIIETYQKLIFDRTPVYILVDELELSVKSKKLRDSDIELVRDLILAIDRMNRISRDNGFQILFYASIRTDVLDSVLSAGYEINKCIEDYGVTIEWYQRGGDYNNSPLLKLLEKKIIASQKEAGINENNNVWETYFEPKINDIEIKKFLLNYSWYRPRDVVRMMQFVQEYCAETDVKINQEVFDRAVQQYSSRMWNEVSEEIALKYTADDMKAIKKILTGIEVPFSMKHMNERISSLRECYDYVDKFAKKYKLPELLDALYEWGIIGNSGERMVFNFLGYREMDITKPMIIHTPLRNFFEVVSRKKNKY